ncbi:DNA-binding protein [Hydrogeniiclostridium mannosilyticum]|uniref:DNA-binding protein n=1 Tax=Hydrogeniiclostridium mannosilyticum TaxID=2764322 RepID=A0A328UIS0_9FIRM|nr:helix-turn-helix domain-containing protein [Hydrogeniiclostridium mannosilyticum]RAQ29904.1 DNA-binding protein [Hydrogeniiclostridium mannosilyticum]
MDENKIGQFILELRKEQKITQRDLAAQLHITDKAVSKWERGLSCPDISLLTSLADILGVTTSELLNGQRSNMPSNDIEQSVDHALVYAEKTANRRATSCRNILAIAFSLLLLVGMVVCLICDIAISGKFTWSLYPISSILFAWVVMVPFVKCGRKGLLGSLVALSIFIIPFLYVIDKIIGKASIMPVGTAVSLFSVFYLWCIYGIFNKLNSRKFLAFGLSLLLIIPLCLAINITIAKLFSIPILDIWDILSFGIVMIISVSLLVTDYIRNNKRS